MQSDGLNSALSPVIYGHIALSIKILPWFGLSAQSEHGSDPNHGSDHQSEHSDQPEQGVLARVKKYADRKKTQGRQVDMSDLPCQYAEEIETFRHGLDLPDPRETMSRSSTSVLALDDVKGQQELRPRGPSAMLPLSLVQDFQASNLPEGKYTLVQSGTAFF